VNLGKRAKAIGVVSVVLFVVAALGVGCGGGGNAKQASSPDEYADQVCTALSKYADDMEALMNSDVSMDDPSAAKDAASEMSSLFKAMANDLDKINPPSDVKDMHEALITSLRSIADLAGQLVSAMDKPLDEALGDIEDISAQMGDVGMPFTSLSDLPSGYQDAFQNNETCQKLSILGE
jgi:hypothetical protein